MDYTELSNGWIFVDENGKKDDRIVNIILSYNNEYDDNELVDVSEFNCYLVGIVLSSDRFEMNTPIKTNAIETVVRVGDYSNCYEVVSKTGYKYRIKPEWCYTQIFHR